MKIKHLIIALLVLAGMAAPTTAQAQFRIGPRVGINVNDLHFDKSTFDSDNRLGFTAGLMTEFTVPIIGVGFDASVMYVRRNSEFTVNHDVTKTHRDYIDIPINLKWKIGIPVISKIVSPYIATGPAFSILTGKKVISDVKNKNFVTSWNVGAGVTLLSHLQIGATYGFGLGKTAEWVGASSGNMSFEGKTRCWTITAAYLF